MDINSSLPLDKVIDSLAVGIFAVDTEQNIIFFSRGAEKITGFSREEVMGTKCYDKARTSSCRSNCCLKRALEAGKETVNSKAVILNKYDKRVPIRMMASLIRDDRGTVLGWMESFIDDSERLALEKKVKQSYTFGDIVGKDSKMLKLYDTLPLIAASDMTVLICGETGTGKDIFARVLHNSGKRKDGPFIKVNCAALPEHLMESEVFGYRKGAFTDAKEDKQGRFDLAQGGTIFLDEIGDLSPNLQAKLLQVLDDKEFFSLGSTRATKVNARVIAATNRDLQQMVNQGIFREDLYFRLKVVQIDLPSLRERPSDIPLLLEHFMAERALTLGKEDYSVSEDAMRVLLDYPFPGNVRELKNIIEHAIILNVDGTIRVEDFPKYLIKAIKTLPQEALEGAVDPVTSFLEMKEREAILNMLQNHRWCIQATADALSIDRTTLWRKMRKHDLSKNVAAIAR
jgi:PAS domain S-box-containing protein